MDIHALGQWMSWDSCQPRRTYDGDEQQRASHGSLVNLTQRRSG